MTKSYMCHQSGNWGTSEKERTCLLTLRTVASCFSIVLSRRPIGFVGGLLLCLLTTLGVVQVTQKQRRDSRVAGCVAGAASPGVSVLPTTREVMGTNVIGCGDLNADGATTMLYITFTLEGSTRPDSQVHKVIQHALHRQHRYNTLRKMGVEKAFDWSWTRNGCW